ncbi:MAG TPA: hypothetical protein VM260_22570, partial [Pirellula sp.]|nr:hypothetical protein [Pirellula sp.]
KQSNFLGIRTVRGDISLRLGRLDEAIEDFRRELAIPELQAKAVASLALSYAFALQGKTSQALTYARNAVDYWWEDTAGMSSYCGPIFLKCDEGRESDDTPFHVEEVAKLLEQHAPPEDGILIQLLRYWAADTRGNDEGRIEAALKLKPKQHPFANREWAIVAARDGDIVRAINHHLLFVGRMYERADYDYISHPTFFLDDGFDLGRCFRNDSIKATVHDKLLTYTAAHKDTPKLIESAIIPLYDHIWRQLLFDGKAWQAVYELADYFVNNVPHCRFKLFDYAYAANKLNKQDDAEAAYRVLIDLDSKHDASLHNLSILVETKSLDESLDLQRRAAKCAPNCEL